MRPVSSADADAYWRTRPRGSQLSAATSRQSARLALARAPGRTAPRARSAVCAGATSRARRSGPASASSPRRSSSGPTATIACTSASASSARAAAGVSRCSSRELRPGSWRGRYELGEILRRTLLKRASGSRAAACQARAARRRTDPTADSRASRSCTGQPAQLDFGHADPSGSRTGRGTRPSPESSRTRSRRRARTANHAWAGSRGAATMERSR